jgi:GH15 family glucan-1,4-alpha-glucosidase
VPRALVIGNGRLLANFDERLVLRELYFPHVGMVNHIEGRRNVPGIWCGGTFAWLAGDGWERRPGYRPDTLVTESLATHAGLGLTLTLSDAVHYREDVIVRRLEVKNCRPGTREVRVFFPNDFHIDETDVGDTALYDPGHGAMIHYKRRRCFLFSGRAGGNGIYQYSTGRKRFFGAEGTWRDAEDGVLEQNAIAQGAVDSVASFRLLIEGNGSAVVWCWLVVADSLPAATRLHHLVLEETPELLLAQTERFWHHWVTEHEPAYGDLPDQVAPAFRRSLLTVRTQVDAGGAILAANDTDILETNRDHYSYVWPRDGALVVQAMDRAGYARIGHRFFGFCRRALGPEGYFWPKYHPDASVGSSWHPWLLDGEPQLPVQEDETALVLVALGDHYRRYRDLELVSDLYQGLIRPAADFLAAYRDPQSELPRPSYDLWEERRGVFTFTAVAVCRALEEAAFLAHRLGAPGATRYREAAARTRQAVLEHLYRPALGRFVRGFYCRADGECQYDTTLDASLLGIITTGFLPPADARAAATARTVHDGLWVKTGIGGLARYTGDYYFRVSDDLDRVPGNPWIICTLWSADYHVLSAESVDDLQFPARLLAWAADRAGPTGLLSEQVHPYTGQPLSVSPLTWSHAALVDSTLRYLEKRRGLQPDKGC